MALPISWVEAVPPMSRVRGPSVSTASKRVSSLRVLFAASPGLPLCWTDTYADVAAAPPDLSRRLRGDGAYRGLIASLLAECSGRPIAEVVQVIEAAGVPNGAVAQARMLSQAAPRWRSPAGTSIPPVRHSPSL